MLIISVKKAKFGSIYLIKQYSECPNTFQIYKLCKKEWGQIWHVQTTQIFMVIGHFPQLGFFYVSIGLQRCIGKIGHTVDDMEGNQDKTNKGWLEFSSVS